MIFIVTTRHLLQDVTNNALRPLIIDWKSLGYSGVECDPVRYRCLNCNCRKLSNVHAQIFSYKQSLIVFHFYETVM